MVGGKIMRVLEIMGSLHRGGAETMIMNYYRAFDKNLCQMDFVVHAEFENDYRNEAKKLGARIIILERPGKVGIHKYISALVAAIHQNGPYNAVHIHTNYQAFLGIIAAHRAGIRNILVHSHTTKFTNTQIFVNRLIMKIYGVKRLSCGERAGKAFFGNAKYEIINNAIDVRKFRDADRDKCIQMRKKLFGNHLVIGNLGRFHPQKNHPFMLEVMEQLVKKHPNIVLALYGEGEKENEIKELVAEKKLDYNVLFMGVTNDAVSVYQMFDMFILPSLYEGFPVTLVEAQLSGVPSLASDYVSKECDLNLELLEFLPLDEDIWAKTILSSLNKKNDALNAKEKIDAYDVNIQWKKLYDAYKMA